MKIDFKNNFIEDKKLLQDAVAVLKSMHVIRYDGDIARDLKYSRGAVSEILSLKSSKKVSYQFMARFKSKYESYLLNSEVDHDALKNLQNQIDVLKQFYLELCHKVGIKKSLALLDAEFQKAVNLKNKSK